MEKTKKPRKNKYPAEGITLEMMVEDLVLVYGWEILGEKIYIRCFNLDPSIKSSVNFLRKTPWAKKQVETLWRWRAATGWDPRDDSDATPVTKQFPELNAGKFDK
ncbi:MAG: VF530 family DNA-binding protein [Pseudobdellovibrio sp.]